MTIQDEYMACYLAGLTVPETAEKTGRHHSTVHKWAKQNGLRFNRRRVPPPRPTGEAIAKCRRNHAAAMQRIRETPVNGWTWAALMDAGYTAPEAARLRGQTINAAYKAEEALGRKFARAHLPGLNAQERAKLRRVKYDYGVGEDDALRIIGREDLIGIRPKRPTVRDRLVAQIKADPEAALLAMMKADARAATVRIAT